MSDAIVAVIAAHCDDEVLGCGATVARLVSEGAHVYPLILGTGDPVRGAEAREALSVAAHKAAEALLAEPPMLLDFPDNRFDTIAQLDLNRAVEAFLLDISPTLVLTHWDGDRNVDHQRTCAAVETATRPGTSSVRRVYLFETPSATEGTRHGRTFSPNLYYALGSDHLLKKWEAVDAYACEMRPHPHPRSIAKIRALAETRGAECHMTAAEAFEVLREVR